MSRRILVAQVTDLANNNAQVLNARALLARFRDPAATWCALAYGDPDPRVAATPSVQIVRLWRRHLWYLHKVLFYQYPADLVFYPGPYWMDEWGLRLRRWSGRAVPVVATLEGLVGDDARERLLSEWAGHRVYCQSVPPAHLRRVDAIYRRASRIVAISPFLARIGRRLYGDKIVIAPLGIDAPPPRSRCPFAGDRVQVVGAGRLYENKRPDIFLALARRFPQADFTWFGEGELRDPLVAEARSLGLSNVSYPGPLRHDLLLERMSGARLFVLPSRAEGVPKVTQEAAACGLPVIVYGYYEAPSVVDGRNGYVVWNDEELFDRVGRLIDNPALAASLGAQGEEMSKAWSWEQAAAAWEAAILGTLEQSGART